MIAYAIKYESDVQTGYIGSMLGIHEDISRAHITNDKVDADFLLGQVSYYGDKVKIVKVQTEEIKE